VADRPECGGRTDEAGLAYQQALELYSTASDRFGESDTLIGMGRLAIERVRLDEAAALFGNAISLAGPLEYELAEADGTLGLAEIALRRGRPDQALPNGPK